MPAMIQVKAGGHCPPYNLNRRQNMEQRIIIRNVNWLGDAVMGLPTLEAIRRGYPEAHISLLLKESLSSLFEGHRVVDELILLPKHTSSLLFPFSAFQKGLKKKAFDLTIILPNSFKSALIFYAARIDERVGYATACRSFLLSRAINLRKSTLTKHQVYYYTDLLNSLNLDLIHVKPRILLSDQEKNHGKNLLLSYGIDTKGKGILFGFNPGSSYGPAKCWVPERYAQLAMQLKKKFQAKILLFGTLEDLPAAIRIESLTAGDAVNLAGRLNLRDYMRALAQCDLIVTNDSGGMHLAAALDLPLIALFGSTDPFRTGPLSTSQTIIYKKVHCSPCLKRACPSDFSCMNTISVSEVFESIVELLGQVRNVRG